MAKSEIFINKFISFFLKKLGAFEVKRGTGDLGAIKYAMKILNEKKVLGIFPEGTRSKTGMVLDLEPGTAMLALKTNSPIVPVYVGGEYGLFKQAKIAIGEPIDLVAYCGGKRPAPKDVNAAMEMLRERIVTLGKLVEN